MPESPPLYDGQSRWITSGSGSRYEVKNVGGVYSCSCPGWRNQSRHPNYRTCKHLVEFRGARDEAERIFPGGRDGMPAAVSRLVTPYFPTRALPPDSTIARGGRLAEAALLRRRRRGDESPPPGGASLRYEPEMTVRMKVRKSRVADEPDAVPVKPAPKPHNAWSALLDDDHPLAEPLPPPVREDIGGVKSAPSDEPEWDASTPIDLTKVTLGSVTPLKPVASKGAFRGVLLAQEWDGVQDISGWLASEKLDGVRAYWDGSQFYSRNGNAFAVPDWYRERMPKDVHLDGEFWIGRGEFQKTSGYVRRLDRGEYWRDISYMVFDVPSVDAGFEDRIHRIARDFILPAHCKVLPHSPCPNITTLRAFLATIEGAGGEGVMLRQPGSRYVRSRSATLLKVKTFFDTEAEVTGTTAGKGRHAGAVGALEVIVRKDITLTAGKKTCTIAAGTEFEVGTGLVDAQRKPGAIPVGSIITFRFQELSKDGIPRFPSLIAVRDYE